MIPARKQVVAYRSLPTKLPLWPTITLWLLMDRLDAPGWVHGVVWTVWVLLILGSVANIWREEQARPLFLEDE